MERADLDGFIYDCKNDIQTLYCPLLGEVFMDANTKMVNKCSRPAIGKWCRFSAQRTEDGRWCARRVELMAYPRLKYFIRENCCIVEGTAVVCNVENKGDFKGYLWNDYIGFIAVGEKMTHNLKPLTAVQFQATLYKQKDPPSYFMATEISVQLDLVFQSDLLLFARSVEVDEDGKACVSSNVKFFICCVVTLSKNAYSAQPAAGTKISLLYYRDYDNNSTGVGVYATTDSSIVSGIGEDFFTTERCYAVNFGSYEEEEVFSDAHDEIDMMLNSSASTGKEVLNGATDILQLPSESIVEFAENDGSDQASKEATPQGDEGSDLWEHLDLSASINNSPCSSNEVVLDDASPSVTLNKQNAVAGSNNQIIYISQEDLWDEEFIDHLKMKIKMKEMKKSQHKNDVKCNGTVLESEPQCDIKTGKEKLCDEMNCMRILLEDRLASMRRVQFSEAAETEGGNNSDKSLHTEMFMANEVNFRSVKTEEEENFFVKREPFTAAWTEEVDRLCAEILSDARLRNFVSVNKDGLTVLRDITKYLECQMTEAEMSERIGIPISELTPACFDIVHEEQAVEICSKLKKMAGFERIANREIPQIPDHIS